jgi:gliding motility-associated-like protein
VGTVTVTLTVTDDGGNVSTCDATVTVVDNTAPTALCQNVTVALDASGNATVTAAQVDNGSSDACGIASMTLSQTAFDCSNVGTNNVTLTVTDPSGNVSTCDATVTVVDNIAPSAVCQNITVELNENGEAVISAVQVNSSSTDNCSGGLTYSLDQTVFASTGSYTVVLTVTDASGNSSSCSATVNVQDGLPPNAICQNATIYLDANGNAAIAAQDLDGGSFDNGPIVNWAASQTMFACSDLGSNQVSLTVTDDMGHMASCMATVTVLDTIAPHVICQAITATIGPDGSVEISATQLDGGTVDNCSTMWLTFDTLGTNITGPGTYEVLLIATDASGNESTCTAMVTVIEPQPPVMIPSGFSPNGDGIADTWVIQGLEHHPTNSVIIFNRWGSEIYRSAPYNNNWNGEVTSGGLPGQLPSGTYFYQLELGAGDVRTGYIQLNR